MTPGRIAELLTPFLAPSALTDDTLAHISTYIDILQRWNARINLTAIRDPEEMVTRHFGESLFAARHLFPACSSVSSGLKDVSLADLGSGAGFPGIPIKLWAPHIKLSLIESHHKKATFLREIARALTLTDTDIRNARAETLAASSFEVVTLRAVERFEAILPVAAALVAPKGRLALLLGSNQIICAQGLGPSYEFEVPRPVPLSRSRCLLMAHRTEAILE